MKKKNDSWNLLFSAFLITAFMVCSSFFIGMISDSFGQDQIKKTLLTALVFMLFGMILFYATRVGDGKQVFRFSLATLIVMVLPALYVIIASVASGLPFYAQVSSRPELADIAAVILGYGIPYTFLSGYELDRSADQKKQPEENTDAEEGSEAPEDTGDGVSESDPEVADEYDEADGTDAAEEYGEDDETPEYDESGSADEYDEAEEQ